MSREQPREILFRGFHPCEDGDMTIYVEGMAVKGRWIYGGYVPAEKLDKSGIEHRIIETAADGGMFDVLPSTVCQCTGLTDKNGRKIFEGDTIRYGEQTSYDYYLESVEQPEEYDGEIYDQDIYQDSIVWYGDCDYPAFDLLNNQFECNGLSQTANGSYVVEVTGTIWDKEV